MVYIAIEGRPGGRRRPPDGQTPRSAAAAARRLRADAALPELCQCHWQQQHHAALHLQQLLSNEALKPVPQGRLGLADGEAPEVRK